MVSKGQQLPEGGIHSFLLLCTANETPFVPYLSVFISYLKAIFR